jgi:hypothetical protein
MDLEDFPDNRIDISRSKIGKSGTASTALLGCNCSDAFAGFGDHQSGFEAQSPPLGQI